MKMMMRTSLYTLLGIILECADGTTPKYHTGLYIYLMLFHCAEHHASQKPKKCLNGVFIKTPTYMFIFIYIYILLLFFFFSKYLVSRLLPLLTNLWNHISSSFDGYFASSKVVFYHPTELLMMFPFISFRTIHPPPPRVFFVLFTLSYLSRKLDRNELKSLK